MDQVRLSQDLQAEKCVCIHFEEKGQASATLSEDGAPCVFGLCKNFPRFRKLHLQSLGCRQPFIFPGRMTAGRAHFFFSFGGASRGAPVFG